MTSLRETHHNTHLAAPPLCDRSCSLSWRHRSTTLANVKLKYLAYVEVPRVAFAKSHSVVEQESTLTFFASDFVASVGVASWGQYRRRRARKVAQSNGRLSAMTNRCSVRYFPMSPECFGHRKPQRISRLSPIVRCERLNSISPVTAIGPAMRSQRSLPKFSSVTRCGT